MFWLGKPALIPGLIDTKILMTLPSAAHGKLASSPCKVCIQLVQQGQSARGVACLCGSAKL